MVELACRDARVAPAVVDTAMLLTSELVTNAIVHGDGKTLFELDIWYDHLRISVSDDRPGVPQVKTDHPVLAEDGRGLQLVDALSARWGVDEQGSFGKSVWFEIDNRDRPS